VCNDIRRCLCPLKGLPTCPSRSRPAAEQALYRTYAPSDFGQRSLPGRRITLPFALCSPAEFAATCPQAILDTDPSGSGLGVWVLVGTEPGFCIYEYAGGIT
jgi:hypothetical protein